MPLVIVSLSAHIYLGLIFSLCFKSNLYSQCNCIHIWYIWLMWQHHFANLSHTATCYIGIQTQHFVHMFQNTTDCNIYFMYYCQICAQIGYICHTCQISDGVICKMYKHVCHILSHFNQPCDKKYFTHFLHISLNKYGFHRAYICSTELLL